MSQSDNRYTEEHNPFQAPQTPFEPKEFAGTDADVIRTQHLSHEASIKSIGGLYLIGGVLLVVMSFIVIVTRGNQQANWMTAIRLVFGVIGIVLCVLAFGIRRLRSCARIPAGIFSGLGLLGFPVWTLINGYILYLLFSAKRAMVFSEEYHQIEEQTPHIKCKTSIIVKVLVGILVVVIGLLFSSSN